MVVALEHGFQQVGVDNVKSSKGGNV